jgi:transcriptional regulator with XRE-family HTH domain
MTVIRSYRTVEEWEELVGSQIREARIAANLDQAALAERADVSIGAVRNLEQGKGSSLKTVVRVVRALGRTEWLETLAPTISISPLAMLTSKHPGARPRQRVVGHRMKRRGTS